jgi:DNA-binding protein H-NS
VHQVSPSDKNSKSHNKCEDTYELISNTAKSGSTKPGSAKPPNEKPARRAYPTVLPKYQNSAEPHETWSGRGKQPRWLIAQLRSGKHLEDFRIDSVRVESGSAPSEVGHIELRLASVR